MNCDQAREMLVDLAYGELAAGDDNALAQHLSECAPCRGEYEQLMLARTLLARGRVEEPAQAPRMAQAGRRRMRRLVLSGLAAAAAALVVLAVWHLSEKSVPSAYAGPVEITRQSISLTILSEPEGRGGFGLQGAQQAATQQRLQMPAINAPPGQYMMNNKSQYDGYPGYYGPWPGMALVRDQRIVKRLPEGVTEVRFTDVPAGILPDTVRLRGVEDPNGLSILEQNYQYDLAHAGAVLKRYVDKPVTAVFENGEKVTGKLLSFSNLELVLQPDGAGPRNIARQQVKSILFETLPEGLLTRPTLMWKLENRAAQVQQFEAAYLTTGLTWRADYVLKLTPAPGKVKDLSITDTADLVGYATVANNSGVTYENAELKLLAGDVNLIRPEITNNIDDLSHMSMLEGNKHGQQFAEKSFFEYHLYTLGRETTIRNAETKQIELVSGSGIKLNRRYIYDINDNPNCVRVVSEFKNSEANGLGKPLPKGIVRLYAPDPEGVATYVSQTTIDHTPKDEKIRLPWGHAFDIVCAYKLADAAHNGNDHKLTEEFSVRNHKDHDIAVTVIVHLRNSTYQGDCTVDGKKHPWHVREVGIVEVDLTVKANSATTMVFASAFNDASGGGLKSPDDEKERSSGQGDVKEQ